MKYFVENTTLFFLNASFKYSIPPFTPHILLLYTCNALVLLIPDICFAGILWNPIIL